ncbi:hypothetical protein [uncultured Sphingomonas sp.]|uniref:hypothetical protein n=1 Tax=uncultured Sphingomonas sp. TaxID=158754 RepID=UPI0035CB1380
MSRTLILLPVLLGACVPAGRPPEAPATPPPTRMAAPAPTMPVPALGSDWRDWPLTPGGWSYRRDTRGAVASFGEAGAGPLLMLRCDLSDRRMLLSRSGSLAAPLTLRSTSTARTVPVQPTGGAPGDVAAALAPTDPLLDALAFSRGRFVVEQANRPPLVVPAHAEIGRVVEDCRG